MTENCRPGNLDNRNCDRVAGPVKSNLEKHQTVLPTSECALRGLQTLLLR